MFRTLVIAGLLLTPTAALTAGEPKEKWPSARALLDIALSQAKAEGKRVYLEFGSPACYCWRMILDRTMSDPELVRVLSRHLVLVRIRQDKSPGSPEVQKKLLGEFGGRIGFFDADGAKVPGADDPFSGGGFPAGPSERAAYIKKLRVACPKMTDEEAALVERKFRENPESVESVAAQQIEDAAGTKLLFAKALLQDGKRDSATKWLERVVRECKGTKAAGEAARLLVDLRP
jgi:hypothetical protein